MLFISLDNLFLFLTLFIQYLCFHYLQKGIEQEYKLGQRLRQHYNGWLNDTYINKEVTVLLMMTSSNGNIFRGTGLLWRESTGDRWIPFT